MTDEKVKKNKEFEKFLRSIGGLENGFRAWPNKYSNKWKYYGFVFFSRLGVEDRKNPFRAKIYSRGFFSVSNGWLDLVRSCIENCIKAGWNKELCQCKEKFEGLRFYINNCSEEVHNIITDHENRSYHTCENCGTTENVSQTKGGWIATLCSTCMAKPTT